MWLWPLLLCLPLSLALSGLSEPEVLEDDDDLDCGPQGLRYTVHPPGQETETPQALIVWGKCDDSPAGLGRGSSPLPPTAAL